VRRRLLSGFLAVSTTALIGTAVPVGALVDEPREATDLAAIEAAVLEHARSGTVKGALVVEEFDDHADVCPTTPDGAPLDPQERARLVERGRRLFSSRVSLGQTESIGPTVAGQRLACVDCHAPPGFTDGRTHLVGPTAERPLVPRHTPHLLNIRGTAPYGWDGRFDCLQATIKNAILSPLEMAAAREPTQEQLDALAAFVETLDAPAAVAGVDYDPTLARRGAELFQQTRGFDVDQDGAIHYRVSCATCHLGPQGTDLEFHRIVAPLPLAPFAADPGHVDADGRIRGFKTPVLRGVRLTAPYFHDGSMGVTPAPGPRVASPDPATVAALLEMMAAYQARFAFDYTPEDHLAIVHYLLSL
jgi:cytochrome c peroxidase